MLIQAGESVPLGVPDHRARLRLAPADPSTYFSPRQLFVDGAAAFTLSTWCGTCPFLFERLEGADHTISDTMESLYGLERSVDVIDEDLLRPFSGILPEGQYLPMLLEVRPQLVSPHDEQDYFTREHLVTWGLDGFWGLPHSPRGHYYRTFEATVSQDAHLYEFVVPMVPPAWNDRDRVRHYRDQMARGQVPTAVSLTTLDICQPADAPEGTDGYAHWGLTHFLLDGHHKVEAAALASAPVRLLALLSLNDSLAGPDMATRVPETLAGPRRSRAEANPRPGG